MWFAVGSIQIMDHSGQPQEPRDWYFIYDITTFLSLTLTSLFLRIPTAETIIYVSVVNIKKYSCWKQWEKYRNTNVALDLKSRVLGGASEMNMENTHFHALISITWQQHWQKLHILISNVHIFLPLQCQHNPCQEWVLHRTAREAEKKAERWREVVVVVWFWRERWGWFLVSWPMASTLQHFSEQLMVNPSPIVQMRKRHPGTVTDSTAP